MRSSRPPDFPGGAPSGPPGPSGPTDGGLPGPPSPPEGGSSGPSGDLGSQGLPGQSFMWQSGSILDQSIADRKKSVTQLLTAQQAANAQLQLGTQQNQAVQTAHTNALKTLAESTQQRNVDHIFASIPIYGGTKEGFFEWIERLDAPCLQSRRDIHTEAQGKAGGNVRTCFMGLLVNLLWGSV